MRYNDETLNPDLLDDEIIPNMPELEEIEALADAEAADGKDAAKKIKAHVIRRNVEDYLEQKALERSLKEVFDDEYLLD